MLLHQHVEGQVPSKQLYVQLPARALVEPLSGSYPGHQRPAVFSVGAAKLVSHDAPPERLGPSRASLAVRPPVGVKSGVRLKGGVSRAGYGIRHQHHLVLESQRVISAERQAPRGLHAEVRAGSLQTHHG